MLRSKGLNIKPASIRRAHCVKGEYLGLTPRKLPNGRLLWPGDAVRRLLSEGVQEGQS
ncbi:DNA-binding protein [Zoogloea sp. G-4-1-14]|uniref:DNA-binding protein n=1 Tax=Zoogloea dura TaxID=2728840 RepID=A0A848FXC3_9RHOO|nr:DNA-binding protein [Zoogloea dura]